MIGITLAQTLCLTVTASGMPNAATACAHMDTVVEASEAHSLDPEVMVALIHAESRWIPTAVSSAGACGLTQVLPKYIGISCGVLKNPTVSIWIGAKALSGWLYTYGRGDYRKGLCGYNGGYRCGRRSRGYARSVMSRAAKINRKVARRINKIILKRAQKLKIRRYVEKRRLRRQRKVPKRFRFKRKHDS